MQGRVPASLRSSSRSKLCGETGAEQERLDRRKLTALAHDHVEDDQGDRRSHLNYVIFGPIDKPNHPDAAQGEKDHEVQDQQAPPSSSHSGGPIPSRAV